eukprot:TRINITY_DN2510_c0_g1_i1.p1 TRINITY_DN2510_c0_g1~~TRINITY_DN2510_c0_g1_i1.p1  ORF type:complete len:178 (-),score=58.89 TRINITY_DN2510_c0_g1_i1:316-849(-)
MDITLLKEKSRTFISSEDSYFYEARKLIESIIRNIMNSPNEKKFRKLNEKSNGYAPIQQCKGAQEFLYSIGFQQTPPSHIVFENENLEEIKTLYKFVSQDIKDFRNEQKKMKLVEQNKKINSEKESKNLLEEQFTCQRKEIESKKLGPSKDVLKGGSSKKGITRYENIGIDLNKGGG